jgi:hypothetical protein
MRVRAYVSLRCFCLILTRWFCCFMHKLACFTYFLIALLLYSKASQ